MLKDYCMVIDMPTARRFTSKNFNCSDVRRDEWLDEVEKALNGKGKDWDYDKAQDYTDSLRRNLYVGIGL